jgi:hypothetical protein
MMLTKLFVPRHIGTAEIATLGCSFNDVHI